MGEVIQGPWGHVPWRKGRPLPPDDPAYRASRDHHPAGKRRSSAWADTPSSSGLKCIDCGRVFAAGHLPTTGNLVCADCRTEAAQPAPEPPSLFDAPGGDADPS